VVAAPPDLAFLSSHRSLPRPQKLRYVCPIAPEFDQLKDRRRALRLPVELWIRIFGVDDESVRRKGDISVTGIAFESSAAIGSVGSIQALEIASIDRRVTTVVLARLVRVTMLEELDESPRTRVGFEFIPENRESLEAIEALVQHAAFLAFKRSSRDRVSETPRTVEAPERTAIVSGLTIENIHLDASWPAVMGEEIELLVRSPASGAYVPLKGQIAAVEPVKTPTGSTRFRIEVSLGNQGDAAFGDEVRSESQTSSGSIELIFTEPVLHPQSERPPHDLVGQLSRIPLPALLSMFDMQRMSGRLLLTGSGESACLYIREGRVIDAVTDGEEISPRNILKGILSWPEGKFEFSNEEIDRVDRVERSTPALLLDIAYEGDEAARAARTSADGI
jgi:uncharacterized protein DUF4388/PilZ domain-containing protein